MKPSSSTSELLEAPLFDSADVDAALADTALVAAMLETEAALAAAEAEAGVVPSEAADAIGRACRDLHPDPAELGREGASAGNPVPALVTRLTAAVPEDARRWVHHGATSQDILDTALMLVAKRATGVVVDRLDDCGDECAALADAHRDTLMVGRTLGQQAAPTTFGRKAAGWLVAFDDAATRLAQVRESRLAVQFGGAVGTLAMLGEQGQTVVEGLAGRLELCAPALPWHTDRSRVLDLVTAAAFSGVGCDKVAGDVVLMTQTEVGELTLADAGGSSAMPHKRNPVDAILVRAAARRLPGLVATVVAATDQEHERATGGWHAEWAPMRDVLRLVGGMAERTARMLGGLSVHAGRMRANLDHTGGLVMAEAVAARLKPTLGRTTADEVVARCAQAASASGKPFADALLADPEVSAQLNHDDVAAALEPTSWLGSAGPMVDRAVEAHRRRRG
jgi:3-carboxy-cis,cis-muconate cycloisomerase